MSSKSGNRLSSSFTTALTCATGARQRSAPNRQGLNSLAIEQPTKADLDAWVIGLCLKGLTPGEAATCTAERRGSQCRPCDRMRAPVPATRRPRGLLRQLRLRDRPCLPPDASSPWPGDVELAFGGSRSAGKFPHDSEICPKVTCSAVETRTRWHLAAGSVHAKGQPISRSTKWKQVTTSLVRA